MAYYFVDSLFGMTTYTVTGAKYGNHLLWFLILLGPVVYYVQEMTVRLGAVATSFERAGKIRLLVAAAQSSF